MQPSRLIDYHMHTAVTIDGKMNEIEACERALSLGIREIAFTNHVMLNQPDYLMSPESFVLHWEQIQICQNRYPQLKIRLGIEMDYYPGREQEIAAALRSYEELIGRPFDLVLGAIHELHGVFFSSKKHAPHLYRDRDLIVVYKDYFALSIEAVRSRLFDIIAHPDLVKKFTHELTPPVDFEQYRSAVEPFVEALLDAKVGIEVNTKGLKQKVGEPYPSVELLGLYLSRAKARGLEPILTMGSDAHIAEDVCGCIQDGTKILIGLGQRTIMSFEKRHLSHLVIQDSEPQA
jgi:histidinol-phosphatase (PHP family)